MNLIHITGGTVYDPANEINGQITDIWISDGKIIPPPSDPELRPGRVIDASGMVIMPGGVDIHCHIAGPKVNTARKLRPEEKRNQVIPRTEHNRSGTIGSVPSTFATGYLYAGLGYTTAFDAAVPPLAARHAHEEFSDTPLIDKGFFVLMGNNHYVLNQIHAQEPKLLKGYVSWLLNATGGYAIKIVNPGGVEEWKGGKGNLYSIDEKVDHFEVTPRNIIRSLAETGDAIGLPHPVHIHANNLGLPGNWTTTLETMKALEGHRGHFAHIQFHSYGGGSEEEDSFGSRVPELADYVNQHPNISLDVGQVLFGETTSMTGDGPLGYYLHQVTGRKWFSGDTEMETGCGIVPIRYKNKSYVHAMQWAIGLEWYLLVKNPWQIAMSTDHPNGGSFLAYPQIIRFLMDRTYRQDILKTVHPKVLKKSVLKDIDREYTLNEIAIITRAAPARMLGLMHKGHLGPGADADLTVYNPNKDKEVMFRFPRYVIKSGIVVSEDGDLRGNYFGKTLHVTPSYDPGVIPDIQTWFEQHYTIQFANYPIDESYFPDHEITECHPNPE